jgi:hypothetical protein
MRRFERYLTKKVALKDEISSLKKQAKNSTRSVNGLIVHLKAKDLKIKNFEKEV